MVESICLTQENANLYLRKKLFGKSGAFPYTVKKLVNGTYAIVDRSGTMMRIPEKETNNDLIDIRFNRAEESDTTNETK